MKGCSTREGLLLFLSVPRPAFAFLFLWCSSPSPVSAIAATITPHQVRHHGDGVAAIAAVQGAPPGEVVEAEENPTWAVRHAALRAAHRQLLDPGHGRTYDRGPTRLASTGGPTRVIDLRRGAAIRVFRH